MHACQCIFGSIICHMMPHGACTCRRMHMRIVSPSCQPHQPQTLICHSNNAAQSYAVARATAPPGSISSDSAVMHCTGTPQERGRAAPPGHPWHSGTRRVLIRCGPPAVYTLCWSATEGGEQQRATETGQALQHTLGETDRSSDTACSNATHRHMHTSPDPLTSQSRLAP